MTPQDIERIAREACLLICERLDLPPKLYTDVILRDTAEFRKVFAALVLEEAAKVCEDMHSEDRPTDYAYAIRTLAASLSGKEA